jgi:hypothetical protein
MSPFHPMLSVRTPRHNLVELSGPPNIVRVSNALTNACRLLPLLLFGGRRRSLAFTVEGGVRRRVFEPNLLPRLSPAPLRFDPETHHCAAPPTPPIDSISFGSAPTPRRLDGLI